MTHKNSVYKRSSADESVVNTVVSDIGKISVTHNRNKSSVTAREKVTWNSTVNITEITVTVLCVSAITTLEDYLSCAAFCFNAPSDAIADTWLTETDSETQDVQYELVRLGDKATFRFTSAITRMDMIKIAGTEGLRIFVEAK